MKNPSKRGIYEKAVCLSGRWWLYVILTSIVFIPPVTAGGFSSREELVLLVKYVADYLIAKKLVLVPYMPIAHILMLWFYLMLLIFGNRAGRWFSIAVATHFLVVLYMQAIALTDRYGLVFYPNAFILLSLVSAGWLWEAGVRKTDFRFGNLPRRAWWVVPIAIFSFWNPDTYGDYRLTLLLTSTSPIAYCMMASIYLATLNVLFPRVHLPLYRVFSFINILIGVIAIGMGFYMDDPQEGFYWSILHSPMLLLAIACFMQSLQHISLEHVEPVGYLDKSASV